MSFFNVERIRAMIDRDYICPRCGGQMNFENDDEDILICTLCDYSMNLERYGFSSDEEFENLYPTEDEVY